MTPVELQRVPARPRIRCRDKKMKISPQRHGGHREQYCYGLPLCVLCASVVNIIFSFHEMTAA